MNIQPRTFQILRVVVVLVYISWLAPVIGEEHDHPAPEKLGAVNFPTSCSAKSQKEFLRGIALLHSFAYSAAEKSFRDVIAADPECAMAHWGVAMTYFHPLWEPHLTDQNVARGQQEIEAARRNAGSKREQGFVDALAALYGKANAVPYPERARSYATKMQQLAESDPNDIEAQVFYALALLGTASPTDTTHAIEKKAVDVLEPLFQKYPEHPGIAHYLIHACDSSELASRGLPAARKYSEIAPSAPHALHMPSHIHTRLGMWPESIASNRAARKAAHEQGDVGEELHAMDYLTYAYLQMGRTTDAERVLQDLGAMSALQSAEFKVGYAASAIPVRCAVEQRRWADAAKLAPLSGAQPQVFAVTAWARAIGFARSGDPAAAKQEVTQLQGAYQKLQSAGEDYWATQVKVQINEALAWIANAENRHDDAVKLIREAADEEDKVEKRPVTPGAIVPAREQLGDLLISLNRPREAVEEYDRALKLTPNRLAATQGKARAEEMLATVR
jgi:tetratricopeptide (TPR) repeat protein